MLRDKSRGSVAVPSLLVSLALAAQGDPVPMGGWRPGLSLLLREVEQNPGEQAGSVFFGQDQISNPPQCHILPCQGGHLSPNVLCPGVEGSSSLWLKAEFRVQEKLELWRARIRTWQFGD